MSGGGALTTPALRGEQAGPGHAALDRSEGLGGPIEGRVINFFDEPEDEADEGA